jgi:hypothetical protein
MLEVLNQLEESVRMITDLRKSMVDMNLMIQHETMALRRAIDTMGAAATHPQTPTVVRLMLVDGLKDVVAIAKEVSV